MRITSADPFWRRMGLSREVATAWLVPAVVLAALTWWIAAAAHHAAVVYAGERGESTGPIHPLAGHVIGMTLLGGLAVAIATTLLRAGNRLAAGAVLLAAAAGPMTVMAPPVSFSLIEWPRIGTVGWQQGSAAVGWWGALIAAFVVAILAAWTAAITRALAGRPLRGATPGLRPRISDTTVLTILAATAFIVLLASWDDEKAPTGRTSVGWAVLLGGLVLAAAYGPWWAAAVNFATAGTALGAMYLAYHRDSGWPGVAGWEWGLESPIVLTAPLMFVVFAAAPAAVMLRLANHATRSARRPTPPTGITPATSAS